MVFYTRHPLAEKIFGAPKPASKPTYFPEFSSGVVDPPSPKSTYFPEFEEAPPVPSEPAGVRGLLGEGSSGFRRGYVDPALGMAVGMIGAGEGVVGIADIIANLATLGKSGGAIGNFLEEKFGYDPETAQAAIREYYSPELKSNLKTNAETKGFLPSAAAYLKSPSTIIQAAAESAPSMIGGGGIRDLALKGAPRLMARIAPKSAPLLAAAIGEGAFSSGSGAEQTRQATGGLTPKQTALHIAAGAGTGLINRLSGGIADRLGIADPDTLSMGSSRGLLSRLAGGAVTEGSEELLQSGQEQGLQNVALNRPWAEGVPEAAASGALTGAAMGAGFNIPGPLRGTAAPQVKDPTDPAGPEAPVSDDPVEILKALARGGARPVPTTLQPASAAPTAPAEFAQEDLEGAAQLPRTVSPSLEASSSAELASAVSPTGSARSIAEATRARHAEAKRRAAAWSPATPAEAEQYLADAVMALQDALTRGADDEAVVTYVLDSVALGEKRGGFNTPEAALKAAGFSRPKPIVEALKAKHGAGVFDVAREEKVSEVKQAAEREKASTKQREVEDAFYAALLAEPDGDKKVIDALKASGLSTARAIKEKNAIKARSDQAGVAGEKLPSRGTDGGVPMEGGVGRGVSDARVEGPAEAVEVAVGDGAQGRSKEGSSARLPSTATFGESDASAKPVSEELQPTPNGAPVTTDDIRSDTTAPMSEAGVTGDFKDVGHSESVSDSAVADYRARIDQRVREIQRDEPNLPHRIIAQRVNREFGADNRLGKGQEALGRRIVDEVLKGQANPKTTDRGNYPGGPVSAMVNSQKDTGPENDPERNLYQPDDPFAAAREANQPEVDAGFTRAEAWLRQKFGVPETLPEPQNDPRFGNAEPKQVTEAELENAVLDARGKRVQGQPAVAPSNETALLKGRKAGEGANRPEINQAATDVSGEETVPLKRPVADQAAQDGESVPQRLKVQARNLQPGDVARGSGETILAVAKQFVAKDETQRGKVEVQLRSSKGKVRTAYWNPSTEISVDRGAPQAQAPTPARPERRGDTEMRAAVSSEQAKDTGESTSEIIDRLTKERDQARKERDTDTLTGVESRAAGEESIKTAKAIAKSDMAGLKFYNESFGDAAGDVVLDAAGRAYLKALKKFPEVRVSRRGGDEFETHGPDQKMVEAFTKKVESILRNAVVTFKRPDGSIVRAKGLRIDHGTAEAGTDGVKGLRERADKAIKALRVRQEAAGKRAPRGDRPYGLVELPEKSAAGKQPDRNQPAQRVEKPYPGLEGLDATQTAALEFDAQKLKRELPNVEESAGRPTLWDVIEPFYFNDLYGYVGRNTLDELTEAHLPAAERSPRARLIAQKALPGGRPSARLKPHEIGLTKDGRLKSEASVPKLGTVYKTKGALDEQIRTLIDLGWFRDGSTAGDLAEALIADRPFYHPDGADSESKVISAEDSQLKEAAQAVAEETGIKVKDIVPVLIDNNGKPKEIAILKALVKLDPFGTQEQAERAAQDGDFMDAQEPVATAADDGPNPWDEPVAQVTPSGAPVNRDDYISTQDYENALKATYFTEVDGEATLSSRTTPQTAQIPPIGTWRRSNTRFTDGHDIEELVEIPVDMLMVTEDTGPGKFQDVKRYAEWWRDGIEPPPIDVIQTDKGTLNTQGHRRLLAAKALGKKTIKAWVSWTVPSNRDAKPMVGLTYELAKSGVEKRAIRNPPSGSTIQSDDAKRLEALKAELSTSEEPSFLKAQTAPKSGPAQKALNVEKTEGGQQMMLPGGVAFGSNVERKRTEGREAQGPLFQQEAEAEKKADAAKQQSLVSDAKYVPTTIAEAAARMKQKAAPKADHPRDANLEGFTASMDPMKKGRVLKSLARDITSDISGRTMPYSHAGLVEAIVSDDGSVVPHSKDVRRLFMSKGTFLSERDIGATAMNYAEYLIAKRDAAKQQTLGDETEETGLAKVAPQEVKVSQVIPPKVTDEYGPPVEGVTTHFNGDLVAYTGNREQLHGALFDEILYLEGARENELGVMHPRQRPKGRTKTVELVHPNGRPTLAQSQAKPEAKADSTIREIVLANVPTGDASSLTGPRFASARKAIAKVLGLKGDPGINALTAELNKRAGVNPVATIRDRTLQLQRWILNKDAGTKFATAPKKDEPRDLIIQHNLTAANLIHADKMGGLAVPSMAVAKADMPLEGFGEITLLGDKNLADPRESGMQVFGGDIYSPRYPTIRYKIHKEKVVDDALKESNKAIGYSDWLDEMKKGGADALSSSNPNVVWTFLKAKGIEPDVRTEATDADRTEELRRGGLEKFFGKKTWDLINDPEFKAAAFKFRGSPARLTADQKENLARHISYEVERAGSRTISRSATRDSLRDQLKDLGLEREFETFRRDLFEKAGAQSRIFKGYTDSGRERLEDHTLANVVAILKKNMKAGEGFSYGPGTVRGAVAPRFKTLDEIRKAKGQLVSKSDMEKVKEEVSDAFWKVANMIPGGDKFGHGDHVVQTMVDAAKVGVPRAVRENYLNASGEAQQAMAAFMDKLRTVPTEYFEAKLTRAVGIDEFKVAVVPSDADPKAIAVLEKHGLKIERYDKNSPADRKRAIAAATEGEGMRFSSSPKTPFFSQLERAAAQAKQPMKGADMLRFLSTREGVKAAEIKWTGLDDFLRGKGEARVTPDEVREFLKANAVTVTEVTKGSKDQDQHSSAVDAAIADLSAAGLTPTIDEDGPFVYYVTDRKGGEYFYDQHKRQWQNEVDDDETIVLSGEQLRLVERLDRLVRASSDTEASPSAPKFGGPKTTLPGGQNYKEVLLTLPKRDGTDMREAGKTLQDAERDQRVALDKLDAVRDTPDEKAARAGVAKANEAIHEAHLALQRLRQSDFRSGHFDEPNILAHVRFNERTSADGKRVLFVEEIQSDWAQKGRREGFKGPEGEMPAGYTLIDENEAARESGLDVRADAPQWWSYKGPGISSRMFKTREEAIADARRDSRVGKDAETPLAPFVEKTEEWTALAMKSVLHYAAANGFDSVAWTPGSVQNERYSLSKQINAVIATKTARDDIWNVEIVDKNNDKTANFLRTEELEGFIGKELAQKIVDDGGGTYRGLALDIGGEGMKAFYDRIVPQVAEKIGKKFGAKVGTTEIAPGLTTQSLPVTPEMRASATSEGFPLFAADKAKPSKPITLQIVKNAIPGLPWKQNDDGSFTAKMADGRTLRLQPNANMLDIVEGNRGAFEESARAGGNVDAVPVGAYSPFGISAEALISIAEASPDTTIPHEGLHFLWDVALHPKEKAALVKKFGGEEESAYAFAKWLTERNRKPVGLFQKVRDFVRRLVHYFRPTWESTFGEAASGRAARRVAGEDDGRQGSLPLFARGEAEGLAGDADVRGTDGRVAPGDPRREENFRKWFGKSKASWPDGAPMRVFHGSPTGGFTVFDTARQGSKGGRARGGFSFTNDRDAADAYAESFGEEQTAMDEVVLKANEVWRSLDDRWSEELGDAFGSEEDVAPEWDSSMADDGLDEVIEWTKDAAAELKKRGFSAEAEQMRAAGKVKTSGKPMVYEVYLNVPPESPEVEATKETLADVVLGLDVRTVPGRAAVVNLPDGEKIFYVADSTQIKSADENRGTFSPTNPDIRFSTAPKGEDKESFNGIRGMDALRKPKSKIQQHIGPVLKALPSAEADLLTGLYDRFTNDGDESATWESIDKDALATLGVYTKARFLKLKEKGIDIDVPGFRAAVRMIGEAQATNNSTRRTLEAAGPVDPRSREYRAHVASSAKLAGLIMALNGDQTGAAQAFAVAESALSAKDNAAAALETAFGEIGGLSNADAAKLVQMAKTDPKHLPAVMEAAFKPGFSEKMNEWRKGAMLFSLRTYGVNFFGNAMKQAVSLAEIPVAAATDKLTNKGERQVYLGEMAAARAGLADFGREAFRDFLSESWAGLRGVETFDKDGHRPYEQRTPAISGPVGKFIRMPFRMLQAADNFFKETAKAQSLYREAYRRGRIQGLTGDALWNKVDELISIGKESDWKDQRVAGMMAKATKDAQYETFTLQANYDNAGAFGALADFLGKFEKKVPILGPVAGLALPFKNTPANIAWQSFERSPFGFKVARNQALALRTLYKDLSIAEDEDKADIQSQIDAKQRDLSNQVSRATLGTVLFALGTALAAAGLLTGSGPPDWEKKRVWEEEGNLANAINLGGTWYGYDRFEPIAAALSIAGNTPTVASSEGFEDKAAAFAAAMKDAWISKTYFQGLEDFADLVKDPQRYGASFLRDIEGSFVPAFLGQTVEDFDPIVRDRKANALAPITSKIPGLSQNLPPVHTGRGDFAKRVERAGQGLVPAALNPFGGIRAKSSAGDPLAAEMTKAGYASRAHANYLEIGVGPTGAKRKERIDLTEQEREMFRKADQSVSERMRQAIESPGWKNLTPDQKLAAFRRNYDRASASVRDSILPAVHSRLREKLADRKRAN